MNWNKFKIEGDKEKFLMQNPEIPCNTIKVFVELRGEAKKDTGVEEITITLSKGAGLVNLLQQLEERLKWPFTSRFINKDMDRLNDGVVVLVDKIPVRRSWKEVKLKDRAYVVLFPHTVCGG